MANKNVLTARLPSFKKTKIALSIGQGCGTTTSQIATASGIQIKVISRYSAIDTLKTLFDKRLAPDEFAALKASTAFGRINVKMYPIKVLKQWEVLYSWHQPTGETYCLLANYADDKMKIVRLDPCIDLMTTSKVASLELADHIIRHVCPKYSRRSPVIDGSVFYLNPRSAENNLAIYGDSRSKFRPQSYCTHVEQRMQTASSVRNAGLGSIPAIHALNQAEFWNKNFRMICPGLKDSWDMTDAFIRRYPDTLTKMQSTWYKDPRARLRQLIKRGYTLDSMTGSDAELLPAVVAWQWERDVMRKRKPVLMDNRSFLPTHVACYLTKPHRT